MTCDACGLPTRCQINSNDFCTQCADDYYSDTPMDTREWVARRRGEVPVLGCIVCGPTSCTVMTRLDGYDFCTDCRDAYFNATPVDTWGWIARRMLALTKRRENHTSLRYCPEVMKCECGTDAAGGGVHSKWCPKGGTEWVCLNPNSM